MTNNNGFVYRTSYSESETQKKNIIDSIYSTLYDQNVIKTHSMREKSSKKTSIKKILQLDHTSSLTSGDIPEQIVHKILSTNGVSSLTATTNDHGHMIKKLISEYMQIQTRFDDHYPALFEEIISDNDYKFILKHNNLHQRFVTYSLDQDRSEMIYKLIDEIDYRTNTNNQNLVYDILKRIQKHNNNHNKDANGNDSICKYAVMYGHPFGMFMQEEKLIDLCGGDLKKVVEIQNKEGSTENDFFSGLNLFKRSISKYKFKVK